MAVSILFVCLKAGTPPRFFHYRISNTLSNTIHDGWMAGRL